MAGKINGRQNKRQDGLQEHFKCFWWWDRLSSTTSYNFKPPMWDSMLWSNNAQLWGSCWSTRLSLAQSGQCLWISASQTHLSQLEISGTHFVGWDHEKIVLGFSTHSFGTLAMVSVKYCSTFIANYQFISNFICDY